MIYSPEAEKTILGAILLDNNAYDAVAEKLTPTDFALDSHQRIFARIGDMIRSDRPVDTLTLVEELTRRSEMQSVGGVAYVTDLLSSGLRKLNVSNYVRIVKDKATLRRAQHIGAALATGAEAADIPDELLAEIELQLMELRADAQAQQQTLIASGIVPLLNRLHQERMRTSDLLGLPTGIGPFDLATRGLHDGEVVQIGARSGVGKSAFMVQAAVENCRQGMPVLIFSLEMTREQILRRILSAVSHVPFPRVRDPKWATDADMEIIRYAAAKVADWPLHVVDVSGIRIEKLVAMARLAIRREGVKLVCVDYAQIVSADGRDERLRVAGVSRGLTRLAKDEGIALLVLSQLARADRANANRRPSMSDLRESSQLENDAHVIALLHRPWDEDEGRLSSYAELIIAKQRSGETGIFPLVFDRRTLTLHDGQRSQQFEERKTA